jgi:ADP-heptose:LPS heptosyltransferase
MLSPDPADEHPAAMRSFIDQLADRRFDECIVDPEGAGVREAWEAGIGVRAAVPVGHPDDHLITHPVWPVPSGPDAYDYPDLYDYLAAVAAALGVPVPPPAEVVPRLPLQPEDLPVWTDRRPFVGLHPGGMRLWNRRWPLASYTALAARLVDAIDATVLVLGSPDETAEAELLRDRVLARRPGAGVHIRIGEPLNRVANLIDRMDLLVGNDSALAHLAAALSTPTVVLCGPTGTPAMCRRVYPLQRVVDHHSPCQGRRDEADPAAGQCLRGCGCFYVSADGPYPACLEEITVDEVWRVVQEQLGASREVET